VRVLFVCTANVCRSRVAEEVFRVLAWNMSEREGYEARSAGTHAQPPGRPVTPVDLDWANVICVMEAAHGVYIRSRWPTASSKIRVLGIPDIYAPNDPVLKDRLATHILALLAEAAPA
jgi:predicted protein tyrosine phosphatase